MEPCGTPQISRDAAKDCRSVVETVFYFKLYFLFFSKITKLLLKGLYNTEAPLQKKETPHI